MNTNTKLQTMYLTAKIDEDSCADLQAAEIERQSQAALIATLLETHSKDGNANILDAPIVHSLFDFLKEAVIQFAEYKEQIFSEFEKEHDCTIADWSLDYSTCELVYLPAEKKAEAPLKYTVTDEEATAIQQKHALFDAANIVINTLVSAHATDTADTITNSEVFKAFLEKKAAYLMDFEKAKKELQNKYIPAEVQEKNPSWSLNYGTAILSVLL